MRFMQKIMGLKFNKGRDWFEEYINNEGFGTNYEPEHHEVVIEEEAGSSNDETYDSSHPSQTKVRTLGVVGACIPRPRHH